MLTLEQRMALKIGDHASVFRVGRRDIIGEGMYEVIKVSKISITLRLLRDDAIEAQNRRFSLKTGKELDRSYGRPYLESEEAYNNWLAQKQFRQDIDSAWSDLEQAAKGRNIANCYSAIERIKQLRCGNVD